MKRCQLCYNEPEEDSLLCKECNLKRDTEGDKMKSVQEIQAKIVELKGSVRKNETGFGMDYTDKEEHTFSLIRALTSNLEGRAMVDTNDWIAGRTENIA